MRSVQIGRVYNYACIQAYTGNTSEVNEKTSARAALAEVHVCGKCSEDVSKLFTNNALASALGDNRKLYLWLRYVPKSPI